MSNFARLHLSGLGYLRAFLLCIGAQGCMSPVSTYQVFVLSLLRAVWTVQSYCCASSGFAFGLRGFLMVRQTDQFFFFTMMFAQGWGINSPVQPISCRDLIFVPKSNVETFLGSYLSRLKYGFIRRILDFGSKKGAR